MQINELKMILAEDHKNLRLMLAQVFKTLGVPEGNIRLAENGEEAFALLQEEEADLLWSDTEMPKLNGLQLTQAIRKKEETNGRHTIIILTSGKDFEEAASDAGADNFLSKPVGMDLIKKTLNTVLQCVQRPAPASRLPEARL
ncbi:MAG: response regulator [Alphaproteobacteria bacterium PRO2]|nr:response regulator [Alphaproteobacteria bacterium PRO2]